MCRFDITDDITGDRNGENGINDESLLLRGKIWVTDNFYEPISPLLVHDDYFSRR